MIEPISLPSIMLFNLILNLLIFLRLSYLIKQLLRYMRGGVDKTNEIDVSGKTVIVTGASAGIGLHTAEELAARGAKVILTCRNIAKAEKVVQDIRFQTSRGELIIMELNLSSLESVRKFVSEFQSKFEQLHILINNAGLHNPPGDRKLTQDGIEEQFGVNHLAHFLLTNLLLPQLKKSAPSRVIIVSSGAHQWKKLDFYDIATGEKATAQDNKFVSRQYCNSKLANNLFNLELSKRLQGSGVNSYALYPGMVNTKLLSNQAGILMEWIAKFVYFIYAKTPQEGAATILHCALSKSLAYHSGEMYRNCEFCSRRIKLSEKDTATLWENSAAWFKFG